MRIPRIEIRVEGTALVIGHFPADGRAALQDIDLPLAELDADGFDAAAARVGGYLLTTLRQWAPSAFEPYGKLIDEDADAGPGKFALAMQLIQQSVAASTAVHVPGIDMLLRQEAARSKDAQRFLVDSWPTIRERLQSFGPPQGPA